MTNSTANIKKLLPNPKSRDSTLAVIHEAYQIATQQASDLPQIASAFYNQLVNFKDMIPFEDKDFYFKFMAGVKTCYQERKQTYSVTNLIITINLVVCNIIKWLNTSPKVVRDSLSKENLLKEFDFDVRIISRRKALESELKKILKRAIENDYIMRNREYYSYSPEMSCTIRDRFGFLCILKDESEAEIKKIDILSKTVIDIFCEQNYDVREAFLNWINSADITDKVDDIDKVSCNLILNMTYSVTHYKDYIRKPKSNGYQSIQFTFNIDFDPKYTYTGVTFEAQFRTETMHKNAIEGTAAHSLHEKEFGKEFEGLDLENLINTIKIEDCSKVNITGFTGYFQEDFQSTDNLVDIHEITNEADFDGFNLPKKLSSRRIFVGM